MAVKVEVAGKHQRNNSFPGIYIDEDTGLILLLSSPGTGTVLQPGRTNYEVGYNNMYWKMAQLVRFHGRVIMEND